jgi:hypothetical protein
LSSLAGQVSYPRAMIAGSRSIDWAPATRFAVASTSDVRPASATSVEDLLAGRLTAHRLGEAADEGADLRHEIR